MATKNEIVIEIVKRIPSLWYGIVVEHSIKMPAPKVVIAPLRMLIPISL